MKISLFRFIVFAPFTIVQLLQYIFQLRRDGKSEVRRILQQRYSLVGNIEENHGCSQNTCFAKHMDIDNIGDTHKRKDQYLAEDSLEANLAVQLLVHHRAHDAGDVIDHHEGKRDGSCTKYVSSRILCNACATER